MTPRRAIRLSRLVGLLLCLSSCGGFDAKRYLPSSPDFADALTISLDRSAIPADGFSTTKIAATISPDAAADRRTIVFDTTKGTFAGSGTGNVETGHIESAVDATATTSVLLRSSTTVERATVTVTVKNVAGVAKQAVVSFTPVNADDVLSFSVASTALPADGFSRTRLTATVNGNGDPNRRSVTFRTSKGTLISTAPASQDGSVVVPTDGNGVAFVDLQSSSIVETAFVSATVGGVTKTASVNFTTVNPDDVLSFSVAQPSLPADGFSRTRLTAVVKVNGDPNRRTVTFRTSKGTLISTSAPSQDGSVAVPVDGTGVAFVDLQSSSTIETAFVSATVAGITRNATVAFTAPAPDAVIRIAAASSSAPADGATRVQIVATIAAAIPSTARTVRFTVTGATLEPHITGDSQQATVAVDASNRAVVNLVAPTTPLPARVTASVSGVSADTTVTFLTAPPTGIFVSPTSAMVGATTNDLISVSLLREVGVASANQIVSYSATDASGNSVGVFSDIRLSTVNAAGTLAVSSAVYNHAGAAPGPVTITVSVGSVTGTAVIRITP